MQPWKILADEGLQPNSARSIRFDYVEYVCETKKRQMFRSTIVYSSRIAHQEGPDALDLDTLSYPSNFDKSQTLNIVHSQPELISSPTICEQLRAVGPLSLSSTGRIDQFMNVMEKNMGPNFIELDRGIPAPLVEAPVWFSVKLFFFHWVCGWFDHLHLRDRGLGQASHLCSCEELAPRPRLICAQQRDIGRAPTGWS